MTDTLTDDFTLLASQIAETVSDRLDSVGRANEKLVLNSFHVTN